MNILTIRDLKVKVGNKVILDRINLNFHQFHASGHMSREQLEERINIVKPKKLFPIHTENPQLFKEKCSNVQQIKLGEQYYIF
jgi:mRNA degradation ribonuclease J1/J2